jgi:anti-sigma factor RsiW
VECHLFKILIQRYYDGELEPVEIAEYEQHKRSCEACRELDTEFAGVFAVLEGIPRLEPSVDFNSRVMARVDVARYRESPARKVVGLFGGTWERLPAPVRITGAITAVFALFVSAYRPLLDILLGALQATAALFGTVIVLTRELPRMMDHLVEQLNSFKNYEVALKTIINAFQSIASELNVTYILVAALAVAVLLFLIRMARVASGKGETHASLI